MRDLRVSLTGRYDLERRELQQVLVSGNYRLDERTSLGFGVSRSAGVRGDREYGGSLSLARDFGSFWGSVSASRAGDGSWFVGAGVNFAFAFDRNGRPVLSSRNLAQDGAADVMVYHDRDGDGRFDARSDVLMPQARVRTDGYARRDAPETGEDGWGYVAGLPTMRTVMLDIDRDSIEDPFLAPADGALRFLPRPGVAYEARVPLVDTGTVAGELVAERAGKGGAERVALASVVLDLVRLEPRRAGAQQTGEAGARLWGGGAAQAATGAGAEGYGGAAAPVPARGGEPALVERVVRTVRSQHDGSFLFDMVTPGRYLVRVRPGQQIRGLPVDPVEIPAEVTLLSLEQEGLELKLAAPALPASPTAQGDDSERAGVQVTPSAAEAEARAKGLRYSRIAPPAAPLEAAVQPVAVPVREAAVPVPIVPERAAGEAPSLSSDVPLPPREALDKAAQAREQGGNA